MASVEYRGMNLVIPENDSEWREHFKLARGHKLMLRACKACGLMRYPPSHGCPWCAALEWEWKEVSGKGHIYSYEVVHHAIQPGFKDWTPYAIVLVELDEQRGTPTPDEALRIIANDPAILKTGNRGTAHMFFVNPIQKFQAKAHSVFASHPPIQERIRRLEALAHVEGTRLADAAVTELDNSRCVLRNIGLMGYQNDGEIPLPIEVLKDLHDFDGGSRIERSGRFIGQNDRGIVHERSRDCHALLLSAGKLIRHVALAVRETDCRKGLLRAAQSLDCADSGIDQWKLDILQRRCSGNPSRYTARRPSPGRHRVWGRGWRWHRERSRCGR